MRQSLAFLAALAAPAFLSAAPPMTTEAGGPTLAAWAPGGSYFFVSVIAGIVLAIAFQLLLTALSVATGVTALKRAVSPAGSGERDIDRSGAGDRFESPMTDTVQKINHSAGLWTMATASLALFFACWLGVELASTGSRLAAAILGLVIWSLFFIAVTAFETTAFTSLIGGMVKTAVGGLKSSAQGITSAFSRSPEKKAVDTAADVTAAVRRELFGDVSGDDLRVQLTSAVDKFAQAGRLQPETIRQELGKLLDHTEVEVVTRDWDRIVASVRSRPGIKPEKAKAYASALKNAFATAREEAGADKGRADKVVDTAVKVAGVSPEEAQAVKQKLGHYLRATGKPELSPEAVKSDIETLLHDPKAGRAALRDRLSHIDRSAVAAMIADRRDIPREDAERMADRVYGAIEKIRGSAPGGGDESSIREKAVQKIQRYVDSLDRPELRYQDLESDFRLLLSDPKAGAEALIERARSIDRDTIKALARSRGVPEEDVDGMVARIENVRDNIAGRAERMKNEVQRRLQETREKAQAAAEESSRVAATAAWWAVGTAVVSGLFAVFGAMAAV